MTLALRFVARSHVGLIREGNEDSGYAGPSLLAVADGMGGHAAGEVASSVALSVLARLEEDVPGSELLGALAEAVAAANEAVSEMVERHPQLDGMGTTLTALLWSGRRIGVVHIGDSRAYLLRAGEFSQITHDHTFVQQLQDEGRINAEEAAVHPQRSLLLRCLDGRNNPEPDLSVREVQLGDRLLVCSDGLSGVVEDAALASALSGADLELAADTLVELALRGGGPDNITCIVAEVVDVFEPAPLHPQVVGAAAGKHRPRESGATSEIDLSGLPAMLAGLPTKRPGRFARWWIRLLIATVAVAVAVVGWAGYRWTQGQYYVGATGGQVAIFKGVDQNVLGKALSSTHETTDVALGDLPAVDREKVTETLFAADLERAREIVDRLRRAAAQCRVERMAAQGPATAPLVSPSPTPRGGPIAGVGVGRGETESPTPDATPGSTPASTASPTPSPAAVLEPVPAPATGCATGAQR